MQIWCIFRFISKILFLPGTGTGGVRSKKPDFLKQEIYGNLILYNFGIFLANEAALEKQKQQLEIEQQHQSQNKYHYQVDFSSALRIARKYFWRDSRTEKDIFT